MKLGPASQYGIFYVVIYIFILLGIAFWGKSKANAARKIKHKEEIYHTFIPVELLHSSSQKHDGIQKSENMGISFSIKASISNTSLRNIPVLSISTDNLVEVFRSFILEFWCHNFKQRYNQA